MPDEDPRRLIGNVIEESLADRATLSEVTILQTWVETATDYHQTPWLERWTIHRVAVPEQRAAAVAEGFRETLDTEHAHAWYVDFKNEDVHYIVFADKVFRVPRDSEQRYAEAIEHGIKLGIPRYQLDFSATIEQWER
jgi:hypothetical protein